MLKKVFSLFLLVIVHSACWAIELKNFSCNQIEYQWDRKDKQEEALDVYVKGFQATYREIGLGDCAEHFRDQTVIEKQLSQENPITNRWLVALDGNKVVGVAFFEFDHYPKVYIRELATLPEYRRKGIGRQLTFAPLRDHPIECISIVTRRANEPAILFYKALNFKESDYSHAGYDSQKYIGMEWIRAQVVN